MMIQSDKHPPPVNKNKEHFQRELEKQMAPPVAAIPIPIGENNVDNNLLQKMGWSEGQSLDRSNQDPTNADLGIEVAHYGNTGDDSLMDCWVSSTLSEPVVVQKVDIGINTVGINQMRDAAVQVGG